MSKKDDTLTEVRGMLDGIHVSGYYAGISRTRGYEEDADEELGYANGLKAKIMEILKEVLKDD